MNLKIGLLVFILTVTTAINGRQGLAVGDIAPGFKAPADDGMIWDVNSYPGSNYIVIYF